MSANQVKCSFIAEVRRSMPNLNKLRGGKVGGGPRAGAGQMGAAAKYHHNSESRLQQPPSRMQGRDLQCSAVTSRCSANVFKFKV